MCDVGLDSRREEIIQNNGIKVILEAIQRFSIADDVQHRTDSALHRLISNDECRRAAQIGRNEGHV